MIDSRERPQGYFNLEVVEDAINRGRKIKVDVTDFKSSNLQGRVAMALFRDALWEIEYKGAERVAFSREVATGLGAFELVNFGFSSNFGKITPRIVRLLKELDSKLSNPKEVNSIPTFLDELAIKERIN